MEEALASASEEEALAKLPSLRLLLEEVSQREFEMILIYLDPFSFTFLTDSSCLRALDTRHPRSACSLRREPETVGRPLGSAKKASAKEGCVQCFAGEEDTGLSL